MKQFSVSTFSVSRRARGKTGRLSAPLPLLVEVLVDFGLLAAGCCGGIVALFLQLLCDQGGQVSIEDALKERDVFLGVDAGFGSRTLAATKQK